MFQVVSASMFFVLKLCDLLLHFLQSNMTPHLQSPAYAGLHAAVSLSQYEDHEAIAYDLAGAQESVPDLPGFLHEAEDEDEVDSQWREAVSGASKGITDRTEKEYARWAHFIQLASQLIFVIQFD